MAISALGGGAPPLTLLQIVQGVGGSAATGQQPSMSTGTISALSTVGPTSTYSQSVSTGYQVNSKSDSHNSTLLAWILLGSAGIVLLPLLAWASHKIYTSKKSSYTCKSSQTFPSKSEALDSSGNQQKTESMQKNQEIAKAASIGISAKVLRFGETVPMEDRVPLSTEEIQLLKRFYAASRDSQVLRRSEKDQIKAIQYALRGIDDLPFVKELAQPKGALAHYFARDFVGRTQGLLHEDEIVMKIQTAFIDRHTPVGRLANRIMHLGFIQNNGYSVSDTLGDTHADPQILQHSLGITLDNAKTIADIGQGEDRTTLWSQRSPGESSSSRPGFASEHQFNSNGRIEEIVAPLERSSVLVRHSQEKNKNSKLANFLKNFIG